MKFDAIAAKIIEYCFFALFFIVPLIFIPGHFELFQFNKMMVVYLGTTIITSFWLVRMILSRRIFIRRTPLDLPILLFLSSQIISTVLSIEPYTSIWGYYSRFHGGLLSTISYVLLYYAFVSNMISKDNTKTGRERGTNFRGSLGQATAWLANRLTLISEKQPSAAKKISVTRPLNSFLFVLLTSATIVSLYGILEHFGIDEHYWVQDVRNRVFSTFGQPNWLAAFLVTVTPLSFILPSLLQQWWKESRPDKFSLSDIKQRSEGSQFSQAATASQAQSDWQADLTEKSYQSKPSAAKKIAASRTTPSVNKKISVGADLLSPILIAIFYLTLLYTKSRSGLLGFAVMYFIFWTIVLTDHSFSHRERGTNFRRSLGQAIAWLANRLTLISEKQPSATKKISVTSSLGKPSFAKQILVGVALSAFPNFLKASAILVVLTLIVPTSFTPNVSEIATKLTQKPSPPPATLAPQPLGTQMEIGGTESGDIRKIVWRGAIDIWRNWPIFGSGVETFAYSYYNFRPLEHNFVSEWDFLYNKAHNEYLNFLATSGAFGLGSLLLLQIWYGIWSLKAIFSNERNADLISRERGTNFRGSLGQAIAWLEDRFTLISEKQPFATKKISVTSSLGKPSLAKKIAAPRATTVASDRALLTALLSGYAGLSVTIFFGFTTVTTGLLFFLFPAFALTASSQKPRWRTLLVGSGKPKEKLTPFQIGLLTAVLAALLFTSFQIGKRWYADRLFARGRYLSNAGRMSEALILIQNASRLVPSEPLFHDRLALDFGRSAAALYQTGEATSAAQFTLVAKAHSDLTFVQNSVNLNYLKNRAATMIHLATIDPAYLDLAMEALLRASELAPTDPKITYNLGLLYAQEKNFEKAIEALEKTVNLKPDYELARISLAGIYEEAGQLEKAASQYEALLKFDPQNPTAANSLQRLATQSGSQQ